MFNNRKYVLCSLLLLTTCFAISYVFSASQNQHEQNRRSISKEKAIEIAITEIKKVHQLRSNPKISAIERKNFWNVIVEIEQAELSIIECVLDKERGGFIRINFFSQGIPNNRFALPSLSKEDILAFAAKDASIRYGINDLNRYEVTAYELSSSWRVLYDFKSQGIVRGGGPQYLINKFDGNFLNKEYPE